MPSYFDVDAILTDAQKVPVIFELDVPGLGYLSGNAGGDMKTGTKVELPLWLGEMLALSQFGGVPAFASIDNPAALGPRVMNALKADPKTVDLRAQAPHFYAVATRMMDLFEDEQGTDVLIETFRRRAAEIADQAHNSRSALGEGVEFMRGLDETERKLFHAAHDSSNAVKKWFENSSKG